jgi:hypothetical protein
LAGMLENDFCDQAANCDAFNWDNGDCEPQGPECGDGSCGEGETPENCAKDCIDDVVCPPVQFTGCQSGQCADESMTGNNTCDEELNCVEFNFDNGDCAIQCSDDQLVSCDGTECISLDWYGDAECDAELNCAQHQFDNGTCANEPPECTEDELSSCDKMACIPAADLGNTNCDPGLDCALYNADDGDCLVQGPCEAGQLLACDGETCVDAELEGNGTCDDALQCEQTGWDDGDCCQPPEIKGCNGGCVDPDWLGDGLCDYAFNCAPDGFDDGDCDDLQSMMLVINEIDADQPGDDAGEFIELMNVGTSDLLLDGGWRIDVFNGANGLLKDSWTFSDSPSLMPGQMALIGNKLVITNAPDGVDTIEAPNGFVENDQESIAIYRWDGPSADWILVDAVAWGEAPSSGPSEGPQAPMDNPAGEMSIGRCPNGDDTNDNAADFSQMPPSPGQPNICEDGGNPPIEGPGGDGPIDPGGAGNPGDGPGNLPGDP